MAAAGGQPEEQPVHQWPRIKRQRPSDDQSAEVHAQHGGLDIVAAHTPDGTGDANSVIGTKMLSPAQLPRPQWRVKMARPSPGESECGFVRFRRVPSRLQRIDKTMSESPVWLPLTVA